MTQENVSKTIPIGVNIAGNGSVSEEMAPVSGKNRQEQIKFLANSLGQGKNRAERRAFGSHIRKTMKGIKIDA